MEADTRRDQTFEAIQKSMAEHPEQPCELLKQGGIGKGDAVREGFQKATGDILMILDADLTVPPEDLPRFYEAICSGQGDPCQRLVYPMVEQAMRFANLRWRFFGFAFSWLGERRYALRHESPVAAELIAPTARISRRFRSLRRFRSPVWRGQAESLALPIRYRERRYGSTQIHRWSHGWLLLKMVVFAARRLKFR